MNDHNKIEILILGNEYKFTTYETNRLIAQLLFIERIKYNSRNYR